MKNTAHLFKIILKNSTFVLALSINLNTYSHASVRCSNILDQSSSNITENHLAALIKLQGNEIKNYLSDRGLVDATKSQIDDLIKESYYKQDGDGILALLSLFPQLADLSFLDTEDRMEFIFASTKDGNINRFQKLMGALGIDFTKSEFTGPIGSDSENAYHIAIRATASPKILEALFNYPLININLKTKSSHHRGSETPLMSSVRRGEVELVEALLSHPDLVLHTFGMYFSGSLLTFLKNKGGHRSDTERHDSGLLSYKRENDRTQILRLILKDPRLGSYPDVNEGDSLIGAPYFDEAELAMILENPLVDVNTVSYEFGTVTDFSITFDNLKLGQAVLKRPDLDLYVEHENGLNPVEYALNKLLNRPSHYNLHDQISLFWSVVKRHDENQLAVLEANSKFKEIQAAKDKGETPFSIDSLLLAASEVTLESAILSGDLEAVDMHLDKKARSLIIGDPNTLKDLIRQAYNATLEAPDESYTDRALIRNKFILLLLERREYK